MWLAWARVVGVAAVEATKLPLEQVITTSLALAAGASLPVHGGTGGCWSSTRGKVLASVGVGVLSRFVPAGLVDEVVAEAAGQVPRRAASRAGRGSGCCRTGWACSSCSGCACSVSCRMREVVKELACGLPGAGRGGVAGPGHDCADRGAAPGRGAAAGAAVLAAVLRAVAGPRRRGRISAGCSRWPGTGPRSRPPPAGRTSAAFGPAGPQRQGRRITRSYGWSR